MKVYRLLLILLCLLTSFKLYAQKVPTITISLKNVPLETVLSHIKKQTGVKFFYDKEVIKSARKVSVQAEKADLETVLKQCLRNTSISFTIFNNTVVLSTKKDGAGKPSMDSSFFSKETVHGFIYNTQKQGLANANVIIKRSHQGTSTNAKGEFVLENVRTNDTLRVSYMGYESQEIPVSEESEFNVYMKEAKNDLDAIIVQAYGTTTKRFAVGEIAQINAEQIEKQPVTNVLLALQGLVPGMSVTPTSGYAGAPVKVEIRGRNTIADVPSDPLYVIDGKPLIIPNLNGGVDPTQYKYGSPGLIQSGLSISRGQSPLFSLNPADIESITVLKDAAASAMYGSRSGNGVILITTKRGKPGTTKFDINVDRNVTKSIGYWDMLNTSEYLQMRREALSNDGITPTYSNAPDLTLWDSSRYVDWQKELWQTGKNTFVSTSLSGGNNFVTFRLGANYRTIQNLSALKNNDKNQSAGVILALDYTSLNQKLSLSFKTSYNYTNTNQTTGVGQPILPPNIPPILDKNGNLNFAAWNASGTDEDFPFSGLLISGTANTYVFDGDIRIGYKILKGLQVSADFAYNNQQANNKFFIPIAAQNPKLNPTGNATFGNNGNLSLNIVPQISYESYIGKGELSAQLGGSLNSTTGHGNTLMGALYSGDELLKSINNAPYKTISETYVQEKYMSLQGRLKYVWENKYVIQFNGNRDGSSNFGPGRQFGNFWSVGANWTASEEKWLKKILPSWFSLIQFKGTYGTNGSYASDAYQYLSQWSSSNSSNNTFYYYNGNLPLIPIHAVNQDYRWSTAKKIDANLTLGLLNNRFTLELAYYRNRSDDQIAQLPTPYFTGFENVKGNSKASVQNTGTEVTLNAAIIDAKNFSWSAGFNIGMNRNKLLAYPGIEFTPDYTQKVIGKPLNTIYLLHYLGVNPLTGRRAYQDYNLDGKLTPINYGVPPGTGSDDRYITLNPDPKFSGGASTNLRYKRLSLSLLFSFEKKIVPVAYTGTPGGLFNAPRSALNNHWQKPGDIALNPRLSTTSDDNFEKSDAAYTDGSYIRLSNVNINYSLPDQFAKILGTKGINIIFSMQNVFTLTKFDGIDPQTSFGLMPSPKTFNGSVRFSF